MDFIKAEQQNMLHRKRPPLPKLLKEEIKMACQQMELVDTSRVLSAYRCSAKNLNKKDKLDISSVFVKRASLNRQIPRSAKGSADHPYAKTNVNKEESFL